MTSQVWKQCTNCPPPPIYPPPRDANHPSSLYLQYSLAVIKCEWNYIVPTSPVFLWSYSYHNLEPTLLLFIHTLFLIVFSQSSFYIDHTQSHILSSPLSFSLFLLFFYFPYSSYPSVLVHYIHLQTVSTPTPCPFVLYPLIFTLTPHQPWFIPFQIHFQFCFL